MDRRVVEKNRGNCRRKVLVCNDNLPRRLSGQCLTITPTLRNLFSLNGLGDDVSAAPTVFPVATLFRVRAVRRCLKRAFVTWQTAMSCKACCVPSVDAVRR